MMRQLERLRRATWTYKQPLTHVPAITGAPVSDLFVWRNSDIWETYFELTDLPGIFAGKDSEGGHVRFVFFDTSGQLFLEKAVEITPGRKTLALSSLIGNNHGMAGTFAVFHAHTPKRLQALGSHLTERGYVSYRYLGAPLRSYVHGNLDAVACLPDQSLQLLGGQSVLMRDYNLQHCLKKQGRYELGIVNPTLKMQRIFCRTLSASGKLMGSQTATLPPLGSHLFEVSPEHVQQRIVISSRLVMARPLVFCIRNQTMDVFHG